MVRTLGELAPTRCSFRPLDGTAVKRQSAAACVLWAFVCSACGRGSTAVDANPLFLPSVLAVYVQ